MADTFLAYNYINNYVNNNDDIKGIITKTSNHHC